MWGRRRYLLCLWLSKQAGHWTPLLSRDWTKILCRVGVRVGDWVQRVTELVFCFHVCFLMCWIRRYLRQVDWQTEKAMAPHSSTLAWKIPWTEEPGRLQPMGSLRVGHYWATSLSLFTFMLWRRMATHPSVLAWRIPGTGEPDGLPSLGSHRVGHDWSDLAVAAADGQKGIDYKLGVFLTSDYLAITTLKITVKDEAQEETGSLEPKP